MGGNRKQYQDDRFKPNLSDLISKFQLCGVYKIHKFKVKHGKTIPYEYYLNKGQVAIFSLDIVCRDEKRSSYENSLPKDIKILTMASKYT